MKIISVEKIKINYISYTGSERTYSPDYLVNDKYLVEVKPKRLSTTPLNLLKFKSAHKYCEKNNLIFKVIDFGIVEQQQLNELIINNTIKLN